MSFKEKLRNAVIADESAKPTLDIINGDGAQTKIDARREANRAELVAKSEIDRENLGKVATGDGIVHGGDSLQVRTGEHPAIQSKKVTNYKEQ